MSNPIVDEWRTLMAAHKGDTILSDYTVRDMLNLGTKMADALDTTHAPSLLTDEEIGKLRWAARTEHHASRGGYLSKELCEKLLGICGKTCACGDKPTMCYKCAYTIVDKALAAQREQKEIKP